MGPKRGRRVRKTDVPMDTPTEFELVDTATDIQRRREERKARERDEEAQRQREEARREETAHSADEGLAKKHARTDRNDTEMDTEGEGEAGTSQSNSRHKKGHMTNIYLIDSDEEVIMDFLAEVYQQLQAVCQSMQDLNSKGFAMVNSRSPSLVRLQKK